MKLITKVRNIYSSIQGENRTGIQNQNGIRSNIFNQSNSDNRNVRGIQHTAVNRLSNTVNSSTKQNQNQFLSAEEEEELRIAAEIDMLIEAERDFEEPPTKKRKSKTPDMFDDADFNDSIFENIEIPPLVIETVPEPTKTLSSNKKQDQMDLTINEDLELENELFENFNIDAHLNQLTKESECRPSSPQKPLILTIEKLLKNIPNIGNGKFKIRAKFNSIVEKLNMVDEEYHLVVKVEDETGDLTVKIHTDIVSDFSGCYPTTLLSLKTGIIEQNTEAQKKVMEVK